jgi:hypothetical protein
VANGKAVVAGSEIDAHDGIQDVLAEDACARTIRGKGLLMRW